MSCLLNLVGIPLAIFVVGYSIFCVIRRQREYRELRRAQVQAKFDQMRIEAARLPDPWANNLQDSKFFDDGSKYDH